jgi:hypothetical protein
MTRWTTLVPEAYVQLTKPAATLKRTAGPSGVWSLGAAACIYCGLKFPSLNPSIVRA